MKGTEHVVIWKDGTIQDGYELDYAGALALSSTAACAAVVDLRSTIGGLHTVYQDGVTRQIDLPTSVIIGAAQPHRGRVGHIG